MAIKLSLEGATYWRVGRIIELSDVSKYARITFDGYENKTAVKTDQPVQIVELRVEGDDYDKFFDRNSNIYGGAYDALIALDANFANGKKA